MNMLKLLVVLCLVTSSTPVLCHGDSPASNTTSQTKLQPQPPKTANDHRFLTNLPLMYKSYNARVTHVNRCSAEMRREFASVQSKRGIDAFVEEAWTWSTATSAIKNSPDFKRKLVDSFRKHVLQIEAIRENVFTKGRKLESGLQEIDSDLLVALQVDCDLVGLRRTVDTIDLAKLDRQVAQLGDALNDHVYHAVVSSLKRHGIALAAGVATGKVYEHVLASDGEYSWFDWIVSAGAEAVMHHAVDSELQKSAKSTLASEILKLRDQVNRDITNPRGAMGGAWNKEVLTSFYSHNSEVVKAIAKATGVDPSWALSHF